MAHKIYYLFDQSKQEVKAYNIASQLFCQNAQIVNQTKETGMLHLDKHLDIRNLDLVFIYLYYCASNLPRHELKTESISSQ